MASTVLYTTQRNMLALCIVFVIVVVSCLQTKVIVKLFQQHKELSIQDITAYTYIRTDDVISTLQTLNFIRYHEGQQYERQAVPPPPPSLPPFISREVGTICESVYTHG